MSRNVRLPHRETPERSARRCSAQMPHLADRLPLMLRLSAPHRTQTVMRRALTRSRQPAPGGKPRSCNQASVRDMVSSGNESCVLGSRHTPSPCTGAQRRRKIPYIASTPDSRHRSTGVQIARATTAQKTRAPQGAKRVAQAFLQELAAIADDKQAEVGKAAQSMVRETLIIRQDKAKAAKQKARASKAASAPSRPGATGGRKTRAATPARKAPRQRRSASSQPESGAMQNDTESGGET